jgi:predicted ABC-type transport system involved in lysophospholipase L1 biosynthesis ATPase subunit
MLGLEHVTHGSFTDLSLRLSAGESLKIVTATDELKNELRGLLLGWEAPRQGRVRLFGETLADLAEEARLAHYRRVGPVPEDGGLISNLKTWENILLPASYHLGRTAAAAEPGVVELFRRFGYGDEAIESLMGRLPAGLSLIERRLAALARSQLMNPDILIYDYLFTGLPRDTADLLLAHTRAYHDQKKGRASLYLLPDDAFSTRVKTDHALTLQ